MSVARLFITKGNAVIAYIISVTTAVVVFLGIVAFHTYERIKKQPISYNIIENSEVYKLPRKKSKKEVTQDENSLELQGMDHCSNARNYSLLNFVLTKLAANKFFHLIVSAHRLYPPIGGY